MSNVELKPSKLGTKQYWDDFYKMEKKNFSENPEDTGECWFNDSNAEDKMVEYIFEEIKPLLKELKVCDLGTGNGHLLFQLYEEGLTGDELVGIDYSETSVEFAKQVAHDKDFDVKFYQSDLLVENDEFIGNHQQYFNLVLDKGTLDAIALNDAKYENGQSGVETYPSHAAQLVQKDGILLITSCNFTEAELTALITKNGDFQKFNRIDYPVFEFGGQTGSTICSVAFIRN